MVVRSSSGLIWPVSGPVTSGYGWRWGRMHEGIDIVVPTGTPVAACGFGAGHLCRLARRVRQPRRDRPRGGPATAYGHNSSIAVGSGSVSQGQTIAYAGSTGNSTGPHVHFEARVNGSPVDPLGYLG